MPDTLTAPLTESAAVTLENLAFFFAEPAAGAAIATEGVDGVVAVTFDGPRAGAVIVQLAGDILPALAGNMLGCDEAPDLEAQRDALGEVANVVCGNVLPRVFGSAAVFALGAPRHYASWDEAVAAVGTPDAVVALDVEGGLAHLGLALRPAA
jgi:chemotaxis protein CheX